MPPIKSLAFKRSAYCFKLVAVIFLLNKIMPIYSCYAEKKLVYIIITASFGCQLSSYFKCIKSNIYSSCNICSVFNTKYIFLVFIYLFLLPYPLSGNT